jgi:hypothetical protein
MLCRGFGFGLIDLRSKPTGIQTREDLIAFYAVPLLHEDGGDPFAVVESELHLSQIDVSIEHEFSDWITPAGKPPRRGGGRQSRDHKDCR